MLKMWKKVFRAIPKFYHRPNLGNIQSKISFLAQKKAYVKAEQKYLIKTKFQDTDPHIKKS